MGAVIIQMELFPKADRTDYEAAHSMLKRYVRMRQTASALDNRPHLTEKEQLVKVEYHQKADAVEMAVNLIQDDGVKKVMEYRFLRGYPRWGTVNRFQSITDRSVDRRIVRG
ncbi:hypothetical protein [Paenibacillus sp. DCT19]|uniref:hypothetical protein n=1 Tax=Paenibacillus sp. DCT19 TaxID=2211212 RepID=UPI000FE22C43|nr:hypothetical protein [Paenibacillus sp. DCT19]